MRRNENFSQPEAKLSSCAPTQNLDLFEAEQKARRERSLKRAELRPLVQRLDELNSRLTIVEATLSGKTRITTRDLEEFYEFFPEANRESLETIEYYHHQLTGILEEQLLEQQRHYHSQVAELNLVIDNLKAQILTLGESVSLEDETYDQSAQVQARINRLEEQIRTYDHNQELKDERKQLKQAIDEAIPRLLRDLTDTINAEMKTINDALYPKRHRKSPLFSFKAASKGVSYTFDHNGDTGSGAKAKNLIVFDLAVLRSTPLPFVIHDSSIIKPVAFAPVRGLLTIYSDSSTFTSGANEPKQVFFSFNATAAYGTGAEDSVAKNQIIHLDEGSEALCFTWNLETDQHDAGDNQT